MSWNIVIDCAHLCGVEDVSTFNQAMLILLAHFVSGFLCKCHLDTIQLDNNRDDAPQLCYFVQLSVSLFFVHTSLFCLGNFKDLMPLGLYNNKPSWKPHSEYIRNKISKTVGILFERFNKCKRFVYTPWSYLIFQITQKYRKIQINQPLTY